MKKLIIILVLTISGCNGFHRDIKKVDCTGIIHIQSVKKNIGLKLKKYDVINKQFYSTGMPSLGMMGWFESKDFDEIRCSHKPF